MLCRIALYSLIFCGAFSNFIGARNNDDCESKAIFTIHRENFSSMEWIMGKTLSSYGCENRDKFTIIAHGWGGVGSWTSALVKKFLEYRGGCVLYFNFSECVDMSNYFISLARWQSASAVITKKLFDMESEYINPRNIYMYGFSLGGRIIIDGAINYGTQKVGSIDVCEPANLGFDYFYNKDPKNAAQNVQCIYTSGYFGSAIRHECHQNWLMGNCGNSQPGANDLMPFSDVGSHGLCNAIYTSAFDNDFLAEDANFCPGAKSTKNIPAYFKMGYNEFSKRLQGVFTSPTYKHYPYNVDKFLGNELTRSG